MNDDEIDKLEEQYKKKIESILKQVMVFSIICIAIISYSISLLAGNIVGIFVGIFLCIIVYIWLRKIAVNNYVW